MPQQRKSLVALNAEAAAGHWALQMESSPRPHACFSFLTEERQ